MEVDAECWVWTSSGMRRTNGTTRDEMYVTVRELERLLEEADERRRRAMLDHFQAEKAR